MNQKRTEPKPPPTDVVVWRYMCDWKLESLLSTFDEHDLWSEESESNRTQINVPGQLWFSLPRAFSDDREGTFPAINEDPGAYCDRMAAERGLSEKADRDHKERFLAADTERIRDAVRVMAQLCGVTCWHESEHESDRMWVEYPGEHDGVAVKTTIGQLEHALTHVHNSPARHSRPSVTAVGYVDFESFFLQEDGFYNLLCLKGPGFRHENEIRIIAKSPWLLEVPLTLRTPFPNPNDWPAFMQLVKDQRAAAIGEAIEACQTKLDNIQVEDRMGFNLPVALDALITEIVVSPHSSAGYMESVGARVERVGLPSAIVRRSALEV